MRCVHKYQVGFGGPQTIYLPKGYYLLHFDYQEANDTMCFWAEVDPEGELEPTLFQIFPTGIELPQPALHVGTCLVDHGALVWHLYRV